MDHSEPRNLKSQSKSGVNGSHCLCLLFDVICNNIILRLLRKAPQEIYATISV